MTSAYQRALQKVFWMDICPERLRVIVRRGMNESYVNRAVKVRPRDPDKLQSLQSLGAILLEILKFSSEETLDKEFWSPDVAMIRRM